MEFYSPNPGIVPCHLGVRQCRTLPRSIDTMQNGYCFYIASIYSNILGHSDSHYREDKTWNRIHAALRTLHINIDRKSVVYV